jgi:hypothetical protein
MPDVSMRSARSAIVISPSPRITAAARAAIQFRMIGGVRSRDDDRHVGDPREIDHLERGFAHAQQAHLAQVVEAVFVDRGEARALILERAAPFADGLRQHCVEERGAVAALAQVRGGVQRPERRVWLLRLEQLGIEAQVVRLAEQNISHGSPGASPTA